MIVMPSLLILLFAVACSPWGDSASASGQPMPPIQITAGTQPGTNQNSLQQHLCSSGAGNGGVLSSGTTLLLDPGTHFIQEGLSCIVADVSDLTIRGVGSASIMCTPNSGAIGTNFIFLNITNLTIENVQMENCGRVLPPDLPPYVNNTFIYIDMQQRAGVVFALVTNLHLLDFEMTRSFGFGIIGVNLRGDAELHNVTITDTNNFRDPSCHRNETDMSCSGSGAVLIYSDPLDENDFTPTPTTSMIIRESQFTNNENVVPTIRFAPVFLSFRGSFRLERLLLTGATGLGVYFGQRSYDVEFVIASTTISDNLGYASGLGFLLFNTIRNVHIEVEGSVLERNQGNELARGGGMLLLVVNYISELSLFPNYPPDLHDLMTIRSTSFRGNLADIGGAAYFLFTPQNISDYSVTFDNVTFNSNKARIGTVFEVDSRPSTFVGNSIHFVLQDVVATGNGLVANIMASLNVENSATFVFVTIFNVSISGRNHTQGSLFSDNSPGALLVVGGNLYLQGKVEFSNNMALRGGAFSLYNFALLFIYEGSRIKFSNNSAIQVGGAIFADSPGTGVAPTCIFQVIGQNRVFSVTEIARLDLRMEFVNNTAVQGGNSIYVNPLYGCASLPESSLVDVSIIFDSSAFYNAIFDFIPSARNNSLSEISSIAERICFCSSGHIPMPGVPCPSTSINITVFPGQAFTVGVFPVDLQFNPVSSILLIEISNTAFTLGRGQTSSQLNGGKCTTVDLKLFGPGDTATTLILHTQQGTVLSQLEIFVENCPPGFLPITQGGLISCQCDPYVTDVIGTTCNFMTHTVARPSNAWLGVIKRINFSDVVYVYTCPIGFCNRSYDFVDLSVPDQLCQTGRTGHLCGACKNNLSVVFGSAGCMECSNFWLFTIFIYAVAGIILVALLFFLNSTVSQGSLGAINLIFYVNLVSVNSNTLFLDSNRGFLFIWVSIMNLELGFPLCLYDGMTEAAKAGLQCIFPIYLLLLCLAIIFFSNRFTAVAKLTSAHGIHVLATLIYLSFNKMLRYVIDIFTFATLVSEVERRAIWLFDGSLTYFSGAHAVIVVFPAAVTLIFIIVYVSSLIFIKQIERCSSKFKPLMDAYGGPFKDPFRFWFGLRLLVLATMCLTYALLGTDNPLLAVVIQQIFLVLFMVIQAFLRPYKSLRVNVLDLFLMLDLFFLLLYSVFQGMGRDQTRVVNSLVSLVFIAFAFLLLYHIYNIPKIRAKLSPHVDKLKKLSWSDVKSTLHRRCCCKSLPEEEGNKNGVKLTSVNSVDGGGGQGGGGDSGGSGSAASRQFSTTVVSLDSSVDVDRALREGSQKYTQYRESLIDDF